jgi:hypothetical protein
MPENNEKQGTWGRPNPWGRSQLSQWGRLGRWAASETLQQQTKGLREKFPKIGSEGLNGQSYKNLTNGVAHFLSTPCARNYCSTPSCKSNKPLKSALASRFHRMGIPESLLCELAL